MKAILINVKDQSITEVEHDNTLNNIYDLLDCRTFDVVRIDAVRLAGNGLILGVDDDGNSTSPNITLEDVKGRVGFLPQGYAW